MNNRLPLRICALVLCVALSLGVFPARAEDCFEINVDLLDMDSLRDNDYVAQYLSAGSAGIRVQKYISDSDELAARVRLTILQVASNVLVFDKNYGYQSGTFDSGDIYLPYVDSGATAYLVTLYIEDWVFAMPFMHLMPRLSHNGACTFGVRIRDLNPGLSSDWLMGTMLDLNELRAQGSITLPICASNSYLIGEATVSLYNEQLTVQLAFAPDAHIELHEYDIFCIPQVAELTHADPQHMPFPSYSLGEPIDVSGASSALLYLPILLSYDSGGLSWFEYDLSNPDLQRQLALWNENLYRIPAPTFESPANTEKSVGEMYPDANPEAFPDMSTADPMVAPELQPDPLLEPEPEFMPISDNYSTLPADNPIEGNDS